MNGFDTNTLKVGDRIQCRIAEGIFTGYATNLLSMKDVSKNQVATIVADDGPDDDTDYIGGRWQVRFDGKNDDQNWVTSAQIVGLAD